MKNGEPLKIGIIGAARVAVYAMVAPAKENSRVRLAAIAARDPKRAVEFAGVHGISKVHQSYSALIADAEIDLVYVATPPAFHAESAIAALRAGKHVLVEKPFAMNAGEAADIIAAARQSGRRVFEGYHYRHHALWHRIVEILRDGELGAVKSIEAAFHVPIERAASEFRWNAALGGGALMDLGCYPLQWARVVAGEEPAVVSAQMRLVDGVDAETRADLRFPGGGSASISCGMDGQGFKAFLRVEGATGTLSVTNPLAPQLGHLLEIERRGETRTEMLDGPSTFAAQLAAVAAALFEDVPFPLAADDPVKSMVAIDAVKAAAEVR